MTTLLPALTSGSLLTPLLDDVLGDLNDFAWPAVGSTIPAGGFRMDLVEYQDRYEVKAELPGRSTEDVDLTLNNRDLEIAIKPRKEAGGATNDTVRHILRERQAGAMKRIVQLPYVTTQSNIDAVMKEGVLTITIKKDEALLPKKIAVR